MERFKWKKWPINQIKIDDPLFPAQLREIKQCPKSLYYRGDWNNQLWEKTISIVGSRRMTKYGQRVIEEIIPELVADHLTIISGFMYGVDSEAHRQCLVFGGKTIAVLAGGLNHLYPPENDDLYLNILENGGLVVSEYEPDFKATLWSFPQRNRIVSGLSTLGVLVVEAAIDSGSFVTAEFAKKQRRRVLAVPGPITSSTSRGCNWLIKSEGAVMVTEVGDILLKKSGPIIQLNYLNDLNKLEKEIVTLLSDEAMNLDDICRKIHKKADEVGSGLSILNIKGIVEESNGSFYLKK